ncbi:class I SAM-dependent methyltransferase [Mesorhizobium sp. DCY119]|uniref:O-methyltransferase n=1 Tax=Mesorhizobium sp. DCY119 TaxID=2108445 RepID=UPI000E76F421|nr:class I SAM-dependent methyltransferase [Mesorhizobium sp. DCY119]RJG40878.1 class I SAM-dependent methyltransferase [Mesorhizobium sp. DCY119]
MKVPVFRRMFNYDREILPNAFLRELEQDVRSVEQAQTKTGLTIGYPGWGLVYYLMLSHLDRGREEIIIETGTNWGATTIILAQALIDAECKGKVITFELNPFNVAKARAHFSAAKVEKRIELIEGDSRINLPTALKDQCAPNSVRFAFLDASHLEADVLSEFESVQPYLSDDALVVFDNTYCIAEEGEDQRVNGALKKFPEKFGGNLINLEHVSWYTPGIAIWQKRPKL